MVELPPVSPMDEHNQTLIENVHPPRLANPQPDGRYNLVVIGAGTAGLITAAIAAGLGAKVALIERHLLGGDCLNVGCVPSKSVIRAARMVAEARRAQKEIGLALADGAQPDFGAAMERMRRIRARISHEDSAARYRDELGVDVFLGDARFSGRDTVEVDGATLRFKKAVIATGARASALPIEGLAEAGYLTNETIFNLTERPRRFGVIGAGPIGCELAQAFRRLGCEVPCCTPTRTSCRARTPTRRRSSSAASPRRGSRVVHGCKLERVARDGAAKAIHFAHRDGRADARRWSTRSWSASAARPTSRGSTSRRPASRYDARRGVHVNDYLQTTNPRIYAAGDICMDWKFTHAADAAAKIAVQNALFSAHASGSRRS